MNAYFQAHKSRVTVWKPLYGSHLWKHERGIVGRRACKWKLLLHAVRRSTGTSSGLQANKSRKCNKKE
ncbi:hypothetical protein SAMN05216417_101314 [Nitrosospira multiformis]|uniref:Uncharacterized protein n=1 Tax=Nitrosospira multiformis TaxID=1231 RepID=A0A1I7FB77_9PROT|nr:hypothetical protein SAMN05216417_101314 [Nitrosospira multiformis]